MYEWIEAYALEVEATGRQAARGQAKSWGEVYQRGVERLAGTDAGRALGSWVRSAGGAMAKLPVLTWQGDMVASRHGIDTLAARVREVASDDPQAGMLAAKLADALDAVRREWLAVRSTTLILNPLTTVAGTAMRATARLGAGEDTRTAMIRRAYAIAVRTRDADSYCAAHTLARSYLSAGKPVRAVALAQRAAAIAAIAARDPSTQPPLELFNPGAVLPAVAVDPAGTLAAMPGRLYRSAREAMWPTYASLDVDEVWQRRCGAALVTAARAHIALGESDQAMDAADTAVRLGNTMGHFPRAAALAPRGASVKERLELLRLINERDRREYAGVARTDVGVAGHLVVRQTSKAGKLLGRLFG